MNIQNSKKLILFSSLLLMAFLESKSTAYAKPIINNSFSLKAESYSYYSIHLKKGTMFSYRVEVLSGGNRDINIWLMDNKDFINFSNRMTSKYFVNYSAERIMKASFTFFAPEDGIYNLVLDNTFSLISEKTVFVYAYTIGEGYLTTVEPRYELFKELDEYLYNIYKSSKEIFIFPNMPVSIESCDGSAEYTCCPSKIVMCNRYIDTLINFSKDKQRVKELIKSIFFHELGHAALHLWDYPLSDNEDAADEFAVVVLLMTENANSILEMAHFFSKENSLFEALYKIFKDDRHSLSIQRTRNMVSWLQDSNNLMRRWQKILIPHFQTKVLEDMMNRPKSWTDTQLVSEELEKRRQLKETQKSDKTKEKEKSFDEIIKEIEDETRREKNK